MIVPMIKYTCLLYHKEFKHFLRKLQELGIADVEKSKVNIGENEKSILSEIDKYNNAIKELIHRKTTNQLQLETQHTLHHHKILEDFDNLKDALEFNRNELVKIKKLYTEVKPIGYYNIQTVEKLRSKGVYITIFTCDKAKFSAIKENPDFVVEEIGESPVKIYFALITHSPEIPIIDANEFTLPNASLNELENEIQAITYSIEDKEKKINELTAYIPILEKERNLLLNHFDIEKATAVTDKAANEKIFILTAFVPEEKESELKQFLEKDEIYYFTEKSNDAPILLKNNKFAQLFEVITKIFSLPAYAELDLTPFFAPFFMLFFGFCLGDAGYGILFILLATIFKNKMKPELRPIATLAQWFGLAAVIMGLLGGSVFGINLITIEAFGNFRKYILDQDKLMALSIGLGAVQTLFGMGINVANIIRRRGWKFGIGKIGWIILILALAAAIGLPMTGIILSQTYTYILYGIAGIGGLGAFLYNSPEKNIFANFGLGIWDAYNVATGLLGDLLSYIRLFALGLTGGILGSVFNSLAIDAGSSLPPYIGWLPTVLVLLVGHSLNIALSVIGALVHPLRLTFVEFYKNAGFEGNGRAYTPLKKR